MLRSRESSTNDYLTPNFCGTVFSCCDTKLHYKMFRKWKNSKFFLEMANNKNTDTNEWVQWIEDGIAKDYVNYHDYNEFQNIECIGTGGFGKVYRATWESSNTVVALKSLKNMKENNTMKELVNEVYNYTYTILAIKVISNYIKFFLFS